MNETSRRKLLYDTAPPSTRLPRLFIERHGRHFAVRERPSGELVCVAVYKCGAQSVVDRLTEADPAYYAGGAHGTEQRTDPVRSESE